MNHVPEDAYPPDGRCGYIPRFGMEPCKLNVNHSGVHSYTDPYIEEAMAEPEWEDVEDGFREDHELLLPNGRPYWSRSYSQTRQEAFTNALKDLQDHCKSLGIDWEEYQKGLTVKTEQIRTQTRVMGVRPLAEVLKERQQ